MPTQVDEQQGAGGENKLGIIKIKFLGVRSSWEVYLDHHRSLNIVTDGSKLNNIFKSWFAV